ncbi:MULTISPECIES: hypothetical protein [Methylomonas]|uniref:Uncharacterized protein n=2 Tax=Methylomonas TaxID=416 RepID=A0A126T1K6_9GAMM|nr:MULTISPECIES: hypothetical protein [Methylomonas]AMK75963.1 hypothetical protein JT25_005570 [Methylomonas denitrificans]OAI02023.1 hypothetical protein A1342_03550 [Methylomonas methanica]TCV84019.1 hypothetical protein EDE11_108151 [Methylomonas methanica]
MKRKLTLDEIWEEIVSNGHKPRPLKYIINEIFDKVIEQHPNSTVTAIAEDLVDGEARFKLLDKNMSCYGLSAVYDSYTKKKMGIFPKLVNPYEANSKITKAYILCRFVGLFGEPPYTEGKKNSPKKNANKKRHVHCPKCGHQIK